MKCLLKIVFLILVLVQSPLLPQAKIEVKDLNDIKGEVTPLLFGSFIEFLSNFINGSYGLWAQELDNRGFDLPADVQINKVSGYWNLFNPSGSAINRVDLLPGGYNPNGKYFQRITKKELNVDFGISQNVYVYDTVGGDFYVYIKTSTAGSKAKIMLCDTMSNEIYFSKTIDGLDDVWKKYSFKTEPILKTHIVKLVISVEGKGSIDIDEASFMAENNVDGIKYEYDIILKEWKPGITRYPGGWFADYSENLLQNCIGDIDKRKSPIKLGKYFQRMDFGLEEYMRFCKRFNSAPHIVVNLNSGTPRDALNYMEYCNGDTTTIMGNLRKQNGTEKPYNVKYWEVGNEQWLDLKKMANNFIPFYDAMKQYDNNSKIMINGNLWGGKLFFDTLFSIIGNRCDFYSYHDAHSGKVKEDNFNETERYKTVVGQGYLSQQTIPILKEWLDQNGQQRTKLATTEFFLGFDRPFDLNDSTDANSTLETGLWMAGYMHGIIRNCSVNPIFEKTLSVSAIKSGFNKKGERIIYSTPILQIISFMKNHHGEKLLFSSVETDYYDTKRIKGLFMVYNIPNLDVVATSDSTKLYLSVLNRHPSQTQRTVLDTPFPIFTDSLDMYEFNSTYYSDFSSYDNPGKTWFTHKKMIINNEMSFPPHSYTMIEFPLNFTYKDNGNSLHYNIIPNPVNNSLMLLSKELFRAKDEIIIFDIHGIKVAEFLITKELYYSEINVSGLAPGIYFGYNKQNMNKLFKFVKL